MAGLFIANVANRVVAVSALEAVLVDGVLGLGEGLGQELSGADLFGRDNVDKNDKRPILDDKEPFLSNRQ